MARNDLTLCSLCGRVIYGRDAKLLGKQSHERCVMEYQERQREQVAAISINPGAGTDTPGLAHARFSEHPLGA